MTNPRQAIMYFLQVLVHGAWVDGSGWNGVYDILVKNGYNVSIVQIVMALD
jgi:hypothetical protein